MNNLQIIKGVECYIDENEVIKLKLEHVARGLGFTQSKGSVEYVRWETVRGYLNGFGFSQEVGKDTFIPEPIFYLLAMKADNETAREFQKIVAYEVLPSIRKHGMYMTEDVLSKILDNPDFGITLLTKYKEEKEKNNLLSGQVIEQQKLISTMKPKADYMDRILSSKSLVTTTQIAKDYGYSAQAFNKMLSNLKVQYKVNDQWVLYARYQNLGYVHSVTIDITRSDGRPDVKMQTEWTQKGRLFLYELLKSNMIIPVIEKPFQISFEYH